MKTALAVAVMIGGAFAGGGATADPVTVRVHCHCIVDPCANPTPDQIKSAKSKDAWYRDLIQPPGPPPSGKLLAQACYTNRKSSEIDKGVCCSPPGGVDEAERFYVGEIE